MSNQLFSSGVLFTENVRVVGRYASNINEAVKNTQGVFDDVASLLGSSPNARTKSRKQNINDILATSKGYARPDHYMVSIGRPNMNKKSESLFSADRMNLLMLHAASANLPGTTLVTSDLRLALNHL